MHCFTYCTCSPPCLWCSRCSRRRMKRTVWSVWGSSLNCTSSSDHQFLQRCVWCVYAYTVCTVCGRVWCVCGWVDGWWVGGPCECAYVCKCTRSLCLFQTCAVVCVHAREDIHTYRYILTYLRMYIMCLSPSLKGEPVPAAGEECLLWTPKDSGKSYVSALWQYPTILLINLPVICFDTYCDEYSSSGFF